MKLYKLSQNENSGYDTYDSAVVAAESENDARMIHPGPWHEDWDGREENCGDWCDTEFVKVDYLGEAKEDTISGVIVASFNAG